MTMRPLVSADEDPDDSVERHSEVDRDVDLRQDERQQSRGRRVTSTCRSTDATERRKA